MIDTSALVFIFMAGLALACMLVLQALTANWQHKAGYLLIALTFAPWAYRLYGLPTGLGSWWLYALPILWLIALFRYGFPITVPQEFPPMTGEPRFTQESLRGEPGRREALTFYFLLLLTGLILGLVVFGMTLSYR